MAEISAADVMKLRKATGAGMMDCKKALQESNGDFEVAVDTIRKKGQLVASKRADRDATEGAVIAKTTGKAGALIILNCETDFVAKNEAFVAFAHSILDLACEKLPADLDALKALKMDGKTVEEKVIEQVGVIGEKLDLSFYGKIEAGEVVAYIHPGNKLSTLVGFNKKVSVQVGKDIAMQIAAMGPVAVDKENVDAETIAKEKEIGREQARLEGKPENMLDKIAEGKLNKFFKDSTLLNQDFTKDSKKTVRQYLKEADADLTVTEFFRQSLK
ncbi:MAG: elongation factor Ts [Bacteroidales bacterium]|nr:elongation factor Ts [Bacteroidales bacterium]MCB8999821.1 elongation factor Ts [Bacteroidales bacterium]